MNVTAEEFFNKRQWFYGMKKRTKDEVVYFVNDKSKCILSAPHAIKLGEKLSEPASISHVSILAELAKSNSIYKINEGNNFNDKLKELITKGNLKFLLDFHSMDAKRKELVCVGTGNGLLLNTDSKKRHFKKLLKIMKANNVDVSVDYPFAADTPHALAYHFGQDPNLFALQLEINSKLGTAEYNKELNASLDAMTKFIYYLDYER